jgi:hypothetical protein
MISTIHLGGFMLKRTLIGGALMLLLATQEAGALDDVWFFSATEIEHAFQYQIRYGARLRRPLKSADCVFGRTDFAASYRQTEFAAPCKFITEIKRQLKDMLESGAAKYLFPLDVDHAHLGIPETLWQEKYQNIESTEVLAKLLRERSLVAVYHTAEHLDPNSRVNVPTATNWGASRTIIGFFDGRPNKIMPPLADGTVVYDPEGYRWIDGFTFLAHTLGEFQLVASGAAISFDLSFDDDLAGEHESFSLLNISAQAK